MVKVKIRLLFAWLAKLMPAKLLNNMSGDVTDNILYLVLSSSFKQRAQISHSSVLLFCDYAESRANAAALIVEDQSKNTSSSSQHCHSTKFAHQGGLALCFNWSKHCICSFCLYRLKLPSSNKHWSQVRAYYLLIFPR